MVYLRTYGPGAGQNEAKTLSNPVSLGSLAARIENPALKIEAARFTYHPPVHLWDFGVNASSHIRVGDVIYILCNENLYYSKVQLKLEDPRGEIGDLVGWHRIQQAPWRNPIVLNPLLLLNSFAAAVQLLPNKILVEKNFHDLGRPKA